MSKWSIYVPSSKQIWQRITCPSKARIPCWWRIDEGEWKTARPTRFNSSKNPGVHWEGGLLDLSAGADAFGEEESSYPWPDSKPGPSSHTVDDVTNWNLQGFKDGVVMACFELLIFTWSCHICVSAAAFFKTMASTYESTRRREPRKEQSQFTTSCDAVPHLFRRAQK